MLNEFMDSNHEAIIKFANTIGDKALGLNRITEVFINIKNCVYYENTSRINKTASETLVMGCGNNFSKNILLYTVLKIKGFQCKLKFKRVVDRTGWVSFRSREKDKGAIQWFYVRINYFGKELNLDCTFDRGFMKAAKIVHKNNELNYEIEDYLINNDNVFDVIGEGEDLETAYTFERSITCIS